MKNKWSTKKLSDVVEIVNGSTPLRSNKEFWNNGDISWFTINDIREQGRFISSTRQKITRKALLKMGDRLLPPNTILLCCTASIGEYAFTNIPLVTNQQFNGLIVRNIKDLDPMFLFYFSSTLKDQLLGLSGKTTIDFISISKLKNIEIPLPPLPEQKRIVKILGETFEKIEKVKENTEKNLENSKELFEIYLNEVFEKNVDDWEKCKLDEVIHIDKKKNNKKELPFVGMEDIVSNTSEFIGSLDPKEVKSSSFYFTNEHILYGRLRPYLNKVLTPSFEGHCSTEIFPIRTKDQIVKEFLYYWLIKSSTVKKINETCTGTRMPRANMKEVLNFSFIYPDSVKKQKEIVKKLDNLSEQTKKLEEIYQKKLDDLEELKKSLLQKAFTGEL